MIITLSPRRAFSERISLLGITPGKISQLSAKDIAKLPIIIGRDIHDLATAFRIDCHDKNSDNALELRIISEKMIIDHIGAALDFGVINVTGNVGAYIGAGMTGGNITVQGDCDYGAAEAMMGGKITLHGNCATHLAGAKPGALTGMAGGIVIVHGDALGDVCLGMKRGLVVVNGRVLGMTGNAMIGGTIMVKGAVATPCGVAMRKGSILALGGFINEREIMAAGEIPLHPIPHLPSFADCLQHDLGIMRLWQREAASLGLDEWVACLASPQKFHRLMGDRSVNGIGEILFPTKPTT